MKVKLNRGPGSGTRLIQPDYTVTVVFQQPKRLAMEDIYYTGRAHPMTIDFQYRRGTYSKSNVQLKDGTWVFEWMGWIK